MDGQTTVRPVAVTAAARVVPARASDGRRIARTATRPGSRAGPGATQGSWTGAWSWTVNGPQASPATWMPTQSKRSPDAVAIETS